MTPSRLPTVLLGSLLATSYFVFHAVFGAHGLQTKHRLIERAGDLAREVAVLEAVRLRLRQDVAALALEPPAADAVEEVARGVLGLIRPGDRLVVRPLKGVSADTRGPAAD